MQLHKNIFLKRTELYAFLCWPRGERQREEVYVRMKESEKIKKEN